MAGNSPIARLAALLEASGAEPQITPGRLAPSTIYDLEYRAFVVALAFQVHAISDKHSKKPRIQARRLKLIQFVAMRPWLVPVMRHWSLTRHDAQRSLDTEEGLKRGFIGDSMHDDVIDFLIAAGAIRREELFVTLGVKLDLLGALSAEAIDKDLFRSELVAIRELQSIAVTNEMLEGW